MIQTTCLSIERKIVLVRVETVLVGVKMAEVLTSEYFDGENCIRSVILESELTVVVRAKLCLPPLDPYFRRRIVMLWKSGENISSIVRILQTEGRKTTQKTVRRWIFRQQNNRGLKDSHQSGWLSKITHEIANYLDEQLKEDDKLSSVELQRLVSRKFAVELSLLPYADTCAHHCYVW